MENCANLERSSQPFAGSTPLHQSLLVRMLAGSVSPLLLCALSVVLVWRPLPVDKRGPLCQALVSSPPSTSVSAHSYANKIVRKRASLSCPSNLFGWSGATLRQTHLLARTHSMCDALIFLRFASRQAFFQRIYQSTTGTLRRIVVSFLTSPSPHQDGGVNVL